ncbi:MAG: cob(I)yrinic acid a,c-diamide adenosyltransferase [Candidatus Levybacteria bacterium]|nr:cob(I)yrinic acid a,c-diamide adenosyltransferase [Candidatus Levybacteria bacterium]
MVKVYTRTGDKGQTSLFGGKRVSKANLRVEAYGTIDELNCVIGVSITQIKSSPLRQGFVGQAKLKAQLIAIQKDLFEIGSILADSKRLNLGQGSTLIKKRIKEQEQLIDELTKELPELKNFILPGGGETGSMLHLARAICRRAERRVVQLSVKEKVDGDILIYLNRLSDLLFVMARFANFKENKNEVIWPFEANASQGKSKK